MIDIMRLEVVDLTKNAKDTKEIDILVLAERITVEPLDDKWMVKFIEPYRLAELFDEKSEAIREMVGLKRDYLRLRDEKKQENETVKVFEPDEDDDEESLSVDDLNIYYSDEEDETGL